MDFLFIFRTKYSELQYMYQKKGIKLGSKEYKKDFLKLKSIQSGWVDAVSDESYWISKHSYIFDWLNSIIPYHIWLNLCRVLFKIKVIRMLDVLFFNFDVLIKGFKNKFKYVMYYENRVLRITEKLLMKRGVKVIEYDGRAPSISKRDFSKDIESTNKYLVSCMDFSPLIKYNKDNFRQIILGLNKNIVLNEPLDSINRSIDILHIGSINSTSFSKRAEILDYILYEFLDDYIIKLYGSKEDIDMGHFSGLSKVNISHIYSDEKYEILKNAKVTLVIPSDDHIKIGSGMPSRLFENAAFGVLQLIYRTSAIENTDFIEGIHYLGFSSNEELKEKIELIIRNETLRVNIASEALSLYRTKYTAQEQFHNLIKSITV